MAAPIFDMAPSVEFTFSYERFRKYIDTNKIIELTFIKMFLVNFRVLKVGVRPANQNCCFN